MESVRDWAGGGHSFPPGAALAPVHAQSLRAPARLRSVLADPNIRGHPTNQTQEAQEEKGTTLP
eukprot:1172129-Prorocentrum_minimum.AAC.2